MTAGTRLTALVRGRGAVGPALRRRRGWLLGACLLVLATSAGLLFPAAGTATTLSERSAQAVSETAATRQALLSAELVAVRTLSANAVSLSGPGDDYQAEITLASQSLEQVAEANVAGTGGSETLQLIASLVTSYTGRVQQAAAAFADSDDTLGTAELWYAADLLHMPREGILAELTQLDRQETAAVTDLGTGFPLRPWTIAIWAVPLAALLVLLVLVQVQLAVRVRRLLNGALAAAGVVALAVLIAGPVLALSADAGIAGSLRTLAAAQQQALVKAGDTDITGQQNLAPLIDRACADTSDGCGATVDAVQAGEAGRARPDTGPVLNPLTVSAAQDGAATTFLGLAIGLAVAAAGCGALVLAGLRNRINEYRYRS